MLDRIAGGDWRVALLNVILLMLWGALPILLIAYVRQSLMIRRIRRSCPAQIRSVGIGPRACSLSGCLRAACRD